MAFDNPAALERFVDWSKHQPGVKTGKELRKSLFRTHSRNPVLDLADAEKAEVLAAIKLRMESRPAEKGAP